MIGLVDYASNSESEDDVPEDEDTPQKDSYTDVDQKSLFALFSDVVEEAEDEYVNNEPEVTESSSKRIKIDVPKLTEDVPNELIVRDNQNQKKCGLFSILPAPKVTPLTNTCFLPQSLQKNIKSPASVHKSSNILSAPHIQPISNTKKVEICKQTVQKSDSESDDESTVSPIICDDETWNTLFLKTGRHLDLPEPKKSAVEQPDLGVIDLAPEAEKPYVGLDNQAFRKLLGTAKAKRVQKFKTVDLEEDKIHPNREEWLKSLTDPSFEAAPLVKEPINRTSLVKNHITSLAERALASDKELQTRWAICRQNRNQTRIKYGF